MKSIVSAADQLFVDDHAVERLVIRLVRPDLIFIENVIRERFGTEKVAESEKILLENLLLLYEIRLDFAKELLRSPERNHSVKIGKCCEIAVQQGRNPTAGVRSNVDPSTRGLGKLNIFLLKRPRGDGFRQWFGWHIKSP